VTVRGLHKGFGATEVLRGVDLDVGSDETVCLIGRSGSGKSTLLRCLNLLEPPTSGEIYPREVEEVLLQHPNVTEVSVIGKADPEWGETVVACVVVDDSTVHAVQLDHFCQEHMTAFKRPRHYHFLATLPKSDNGKVLKTVLRTTHSGPSPMPTQAGRLTAQPEESP
jgi:ABC-type cobalamin/Fe3+-siderophores transport system ATPase subunit